MPLDGRAASADAFEGMGHACDLLGLVAPAAVTPYCLRHLDPCWAVMRSRGQRVGDLVQDGVQHPGLFIEPDESAG